MLLALVVAASDGGPAVAAALRLGEVCTLHLLATRMAPWGFGEDLDLDDPQPYDIDEAHAVIEVPGANEVDLGRVHGRQLATLRAACRTLGWAEERKADHGER